MPVWIVLIKIFVVLGGAMAVIGFVVGLFSGATSRSVWDIAPSSLEPGVYRIRSYDEHYAGAAWSHIFWKMCGVGVLLVLITLGLAYLTGAPGYMTGNLAINDFCYYINNQNYQAAYDHFSSYIQKSYSEKYFETYLKNNLVKGCNANSTYAEFYTGLVSQNVPLSTIDDPVYGDVRINTFPFDLWKT